MNTVNELRRPPLTSVVALLALLLFLRKRLCAPGSDEQERERTLTSLNQDRRAALLDGLSDLPQVFQLTGLSRSDVELLRRATSIARKNRSLTDAQLRKALTKLLPALEHWDENALGWQILRALITLTDDLERRPVRSSKQHRVYSSRAHVLALHALLALEGEQDVGWILEFLLNERELAEARITYHRTVRDPCYSAELEAKYGSDRELPGLLSALAQWETHLREFGERTLNATVPVTDLMAGFGAEDSVNDALATVTDGLGEVDRSRLRDEATAAEPKTIDDLALEYLSEPSDGIAQEMSAQFHTPTEDSAAAPVRPVLHPMVAQASQSSSDAAKRILADRHEAPRRSRDSDSHSPGERLYEIDGVFLFGVIGLLAFWSFLVPPEWFGQHFAYWYEIAGAFKLMLLLALLPLAFRLMPPLRALAT